MIETILGLISNVGFPIAVCIVLFWFINNNMKHMQTALEALKQTVDNNTIVVDRLNDRLDKLEEREYDGKR